ncbi:unnamed protein product, partial [Symbiodinium pilosum]
ARALPDDSGLRASNAEGFCSEEECYLQSDRCRGLRATLVAVQQSLLESPKQRAFNSRRSSGKKSCLQSEGCNGGDGSARLDAFLSLFGASREVKVATYKDGHPLRVTCARVDRPDQPLLIQRAQKGQGHSTGEKEEAFQEVDDTAVRQAATLEYCKAVSASKSSLPWPPMGFVWAVS